MTVNKIERLNRGFLADLRANIDIETVTEKADIRAAAIQQFTRELDGKLANLQDGETLQITFRVDIVSANGQIRGGSGAQRNMPEYIAWRKSVYERDRYTCQDCGATKNLQAHHIKHWQAHPELRFDVGNGVTLCRDCHARHHPHIGFLNNGKTEQV